MKSPNVTEEHKFQRRKQIGAQIKERRLALDLSQEELGELMGGGKSAISKIEAGHLNFGINDFIQFEVNLNFKIELF